MIEKLQTTIACSDCKVERQVRQTAKGKGSVHPPWKRHPDDTIYCGTCWRKRYMLRAITIPIAGPVGRTWPELRKALALCWAQSTSLANWTVHQLAKHDIVRLPSMEKLPSSPKVYLYPEACRSFPNMASQSVVAVLHAAEGKYRKERLNVLWRHAASWPDVRYPMPYPVHNKGWKVVRSENGLITITARLNNERWTLRLRGGDGFRRQLKAIALLLTGQAIAGELSLYRQRANPGDHRNGTEDRAPGGGQRVMFRIMAKMVLWLPRPEPSAKRQQALMVQTATDHFFVASVPGREQPWVINGDHIRRRVQAHKKYVQRMMEDLKHEKRWPAAMRQQMKDALDRRCNKHARRIDSFLHEVSHQVAMLAKRSEVAKVIWDQREEGYFRQGFPWHKLCTYLGYKLDEWGIALEDARGDVMNESESPDVDES
jgi:hypothetical protein